MSDEYVCHYKGCSKISEYEWTVQGIAKYGATVQTAVYCDVHSRTFAEPSDAHSNKRVVNHE